MKKDDWTVGELQRELRRLTANLLRIMAGAGEVQHLEKQLKEMATLLNQIAEQQGWNVADNAMQEGLQIHWRSVDEEDGLKASIIEGALRVAAAKLLGQHPNAFNRASSFQDDLYRYAEFRENLRHVRLVKMKRKGHAS